MAYNETLAQRIRNHLSSHPAYSEKKMFGGIGFMIAGNMACGVKENGVMARVGKERYEEALQEPGIVIFPETGRPMRGWVTVTPPACESDQELYKWVDECVQLAETLPPK